MHLRNIFARIRRPPFAALLAEATLAEDAEIAQSAPDAEAPAPTLSSDRARLALAETLWGEGFLAPGGAAELRRLVAPLGASAASSLLLLGLGAGGPPRVLAGEIGAWVFGADPDPALVALAARRLQRAGAALAKRATATVWQPGALDRHRKGFNHAIAIDSLRQRAPGEILPDLVASIRSGGQLVLQELVLTSPGPMPAAELAAWCRLEARAPDLSCEADITARLQALGLDIRVVEDQSARHARLALQGWHQLLASLTARPPPAQARLLVTEAECWLRRLRLMQSGKLRLVRWGGIAR